MLTPPPAPEPGEPAPPPAKKRDRGDQSYADIATSFKALSDAVGKLAGYTPPDSAISATNLATLRTNNDSVAAKDTDLDGAQRARFAIFFAGEDCLQVKFQAVKNAVKGQCGQDSPQFAEVKGIKWQGAGGGHCAPGESRDCSCRPAGARTLRCDVPQPGAGWRQMGGIRRLKRAGDFEMVRCLL